MRSSMGSYLPSTFTQGSRSLDDGELGDLVRASSRSICWRVFIPIYEGTPEMATLPKAAASRSFAFRGLSMRVCDSPLRAPGHPPDGRDRGGNVLYARASGYAPLAPFACGRGPPPGVAPRSYASKSRPQVVSRFHFSKVRRSFSGQR